jgi:hypothetical protein
MTSLVRSPQELARGGAWIVVVLTAIDLAGREIARRSLFHAVLGVTPSTGAVVVVALLAAIVGIVAARGPSAVAAARLWRDKQAWLVLGALFTVGLALQLQLGARLQSDGFYYFAYLRSLAFDRDVDFMNDYRMLGLGDKTYLFQPTKTGHAESAWTIGPAIVWSPFFAAGHVVATRLHASGRDVSTDGTSFPYRQSVCVASLFYGLLGCWFAYRLTRLFFPARLAAAAVTLTIAGSFMVWYLVKEPSMTHAASMAAVAGFTWMWAATRERRTLRSWALLGLLAGFMALIRWQNILFALLPGLDAFQLLVGRAADKDTRRDALAGSAAFLACAFVGFLPQMLAWHAIYGSFIARSPVGPQIRWTDPHLGDILWSARNGLFSTAPILYLGAIGLIGFAFARPAVGMPVLASVAGMIYFNACIQDWWGSAGFGGRRFDGVIPLFCVGLAALIDYTAGVVRRHAPAAVTALLAVIAVWNLALMAAAQDGAVRIGETLAFDRAWASQTRVMHGWFGNPFTYPASLFFALRNGVSPGDYDLLSTNRFLADPLQPYGRVDVGADPSTGLGAGDPSTSLGAGDAWLLSDGWHAPEKDGATTFRWAASPATLRIPLDHAATLRMQVRLHAFAYPGSPSQTLTLSANGTACLPLPVGPEWQTVECTLDRSAWRAGVNELELRFAYAQRPVDVGAGGDLRPLAAAIDWVRVSVP